MNGICRRRGFSALSAAKCANYNPLFYFKAYIKLEWFLKAFENKYYLKSIKNKGDSYD